jgi:hypothetical protein
MGWLRYKIGRLKYYIGKKTQVILVVRYHKDIYYKGILIGNVTDGILNDKYKKMIEKPRWKIFFSVPQFINYKYE